MIHKPEFLWADEVDDSREEPICPCSALIAPLQCHQNSISHEMCCL